MLPEKRRDEEDFREMGALLRIARDALIDAEVKAGGMYPRGQGPADRINELRKALDGLSSELASTWMRDKNGPLVPGPTPFYGEGYEAVGVVRDALRKLKEEAAEHRRDPWEESE
jgi:hypothetical protein